MRNIHNQIFIHITHLYITNIFVQSIQVIYTTLIFTIHLFQIIRSKSFETCPYSEQIILFSTINKFVNIQYMNAFIKDI